MTRKVWMHVPVIAGLLAAVTYLFVQGMSPDPVQHAETLQSISVLQQTDAELGRDLLLARNGLLQHYDSLNRAVSEMLGQVEYLRSRPMAAPLAPDVLAEIDAVGTNVADKEILVERFKSGNALLLNSWAYFIHRSAEISRWNTPGDAAADPAAVTGRLSPVMLQVLRNPQGEANSAAGALLDRLEQMDTSEHRSAAITSMVAHGRLILSLAPQWDSDLRTLLATPTAALIESLRDRYLEHHRQVEDRASLHRKLLYLVSVLLLVYLIYLISRLQAGKQALARLNAELVDEISERKLAEEASRRHQAELAHTHRLTMMGEMASGLAHELNQPLTAINIYTKGCMRRLQRANGQQTELLDAMAKVSVEARRAGEIISRMRGFIRKAEPRTAVMDANSAIREAIDLIEHELKSQGIHPNLDLATPLPRTLADKIQVQQIVLNLVRNSIEAMNGNNGAGKDLTIRTSRQADDTIEVSIRDSGHGVPAEDLENIFESFFTTREDGLGLGLSICRSLVEAHGGRLWATAGEGTGATFHFTMPIAAEVANGTS